jgi:hypothetical protein
MHVTAAAERRGLSLFGKGLISIQKIGWQPRKVSQVNHSVVYIMKALVKTFFLINILASSQLYADVIELSDELTVSELYQSMDHRFSRDVGLSQNQDWRIESLWRSTAHVIFDKEARLADRQEP